MNRVPLGIQPNIPNRVNLLWEHDDRILLQNRYLWEIHNIYMYILTICYWLLSIAYSPVDGGTLRRINMIFLALCRRTYFGHLMNLAKNIKKIRNMILDKFRTNVFLCVFKICLRDLVHWIGFGAVMALKTHLLNIEFVIVLTVVQKYLNHWLFFANRIPFFNLCV